MSHSGFNTVRAYLAWFGYRQGFFREIVEPGAHRASIEMILDYQAEASAIDATVLNLVTDQRPEVAAQIRVIETIGPSPLPRWRPHSYRGMCVGFTKNVSWMHEDNEACAILARERITRFVVAHDTDYDAIGRMADVAASVSLV